MLRAAALARGARARGLASAAAPRGSAKSRAVEGWKKRQARKARAAAEASGAAVPEGKKRAEAKKQPPRPHRPALAPHAEAQARRKRRKNKARAQPPKEKEEKEKEKEEEEEKKKVTVAEFPPPPRVIWGHGQRHRLVDARTFLKHGFPHKWERCEAALRNAMDVPWRTEELRKRTGDEKWSPAGPVRSVRSLARLVRAVGELPQNEVRDADFAGLARLVDREMSGKERAAFFDRTVPFIVNAALSAPALLPDSLPRLTSSEDVVPPVVLRRDQAVCLLAMSFLGMHHTPEFLAATFAPANVTGMLAHSAPHSLEKIRCLLSYFEQNAREYAAREGSPLSLDRGSPNPPPPAREGGARESSLAVWRHVMLRRSLRAVNFSPLLSSVERPLGATVVDGADARIEEAPASCVQVMFTEPCVGAGVTTGRPPTMEDARMMASPELMLAPLLCETMDDHEAVVVVNSQRYNRVSGGGETFRREGEVAASPRDTTPAVVAVDALPGHYVAQYTTETTVREMVKAFAGFSLYSEVTERDCPAVATGNWGGGDPASDVQIKALLQWVAASQAGKELVYHTFGDPRMARFGEVVQRVQDMRLTVGKLYGRVLGSAGTASELGVSVFDYILDKDQAVRRDHNYEPVVEEEGGGGKEEKEARQ